MGRAVTVGLVAELDAAGADSSGPSAAMLLATATPAIPSSATLATPPTTTAERDRRARPATPRHGGCAVSTSRVETKPSPTADRPGVAPGRCDRWAANRSQRRCAGVRHSWTWSAGRWWTAGLPRGIGGRHPRRRSRRGDLLPGRAADRRAPRPEHSNDPDAVGGIGVAVRNEISRRRPIFPGGCPPSIFGAGELNFRVRDGNGWCLSASVTGINLQLPTSPGRCRTRRRVEASNHRETAFRAVIPPRSSIVLVA